MQRLAGVGPQDVARREVRADDLHDARQYEPRPDSPEQEPAAEYEHGIAALQGEFDDTRRDREDEGLEQDHDDVHGRAS